MPDTLERAKRPRTDAGQDADAVELVPLHALRPSPENDQIYHLVNHDDPAFKQLVDSIGKRGVLEPIIADVDGWIISGHRRHAAAVEAGLDVVPCRYLLDVSREGDPDGFVLRLREHNRQREKTLDARTREALIDVDQIDGVLDLDAFEHERREEAKDARHLEATRRAAIER